MSTQPIGYSIGGICKHFLVDPPVNDLTLHSHLNFPVQRLALPRDHQYAGTWLYLTVGVLSVTSSA